MNASEDAEAGWLTSRQLLDLAHEQGFSEVDERRLETWRGRGLLPRPQRRGQDGLRPIWQSPPEAAEHLLALSRFARRTQRTDELQVLLYLSGTTHDAEIAGRALSACLANIERMLSAALDKQAQRDKLTGSRDEVRAGAIGSLAQQLAGLRKDRSVLAHLRSAQRFRIPALQSLLYLFVTGHEPPSATADDDALERGLGVLPRGRLDTFGSQGRAQAAVAGPWHDGRPANLALMARVMSLPALQTAADQATPEQLNAARDALGVLLPGLRLFARITGTDNADAAFGLAGFRRITRTTHLEVLLLAWTLSVRNSELRSNFEALIASLEQLGAHLRWWRQVFLGHPAELLERRPGVDTRTAARIARLRSQVAPPARQRGPER